MTTVVINTPETPADDPEPVESSLRSTQGGAAVRVDQLSRVQRRLWHRIVEILVARGRGDRILHPTLHHLWDAVNATGHTLWIEMPGPMACYTSQFEVTRVDPDGRAHHAAVRLNIRAIDAASVGREAARADGFIPFKGLDKIGRYAEAMGVELARALWHLAENDRARLAVALDGRAQRRAKALAAAGLGGRKDVQQLLGEPARQAAALEQALQATEVEIWTELRKSRKRRRDPAISTYLRS